MKDHATMLALVMGLALSACGGDDPPPPADVVETPTATPSPSTSASGLPPEFVECMAEQGYDIESADDVHSAPQEVLRVCFGSLHQGGGGP
jgi:hypothetical protein